MPRRIDLTPLIAEAFPTLDLTREEHVAALVSAIQTEPEKVDRVMRLAIEKALAEGEGE